VVAQVGLALNALSAATYGIIIFMAVAAAMLTPPLVKWAFRGVLAKPPDEEPALGAAEPEWPVSCPNLLPLRDTGGSGDPV
jgi:hypothetical protein